MDWLDLAKYVVDKIPAGMLGMVLLASALMWLNKSKKIPLSISWGNRTNGTSFVTVEEMRANCEKRQSRLDLNLRVILSKLDKIIEKQNDHGERISGIEGELKGRYSHHRVGE